MGNANWSAAINVAGVKARSPGGGYTEPATGAYKVKITGTEQYEKDGKQSVQVQTVIVGGEFDGSETRIFLGLDLSKSGNQRSWRAALASIGVSDSQLDSGVLTVNNQLFDGAEAYIYYKAKSPDDANSQSQREFITPSQFATLTSQTGAPAAATSGATIPAAAGAVPAMNVPQPTGAAARLRGMAASRQ